eukprot:g27504.t1
MACFQPLHSCPPKAKQVQTQPMASPSIIRKGMEGVTNSTIKQHLLSDNLLSDAQFGFRQGHSAPDPITALAQTWTKELNSR